jgi:hypothetical protein
MSKFAHRSVAIIQFLKILHRKIHFLIYFPTMIFGADMGGNLVILSLKPHHTSVAWHSDALSKTLFIWLVLPEPADIIELNIQRPHQLCKLYQVRCGNGNTCIVDIFFCK